MQSQKSRSEYDRRMHRVLEHIDRHLDEPLDLDTLAAVAHFSSFHFHRIFSAWMGETLGEYMRRRKLELAAVRLVSQPEAPVLHVALAVGFGSAEAFTRAFKARFGCSPTKWRLKEGAKGRLRFVRANRAGPLRNSKHSQANSKASQAAASRLWNPRAWRKRALEATMNAKVIDREPTTVAYIRHTGPYGPPIFEFWQKTVYPWMVMNNLLGSPRYGISHDDPSVTAAEKCRYDACVEVPPGFTGSGKYFTTTIPGGKYAIAKFKGTAAEIPGVWQWLLRDWLPGSGMQLASLPSFEYYSSESSYDPRTGVFECDICVPVTPL